MACEDARAVSHALSTVLSVRGIVEKEREIFLVGRTRAHLDRVENLGCFVELEVVNDVPSVASLRSRSLDRVITMAWTK